jgi:hypothetical protein
MSRIFTKYIQNEDIDIVGELYRRFGMLERRLTEVELELDRRQIHGQGFEPVLINGYAQPPDGTERFSVKAISGGLPHFTGHLDLAGATSGTTAFTLSLEPSDFALPEDIYLHTVSTPDHGGTFIIVLVRIDSATGDVVFTWPAT